MAAATPPPAERAARRLLRDVGVSYLRARGARWMDTLQLDFNPYLLEFGATDKRPAEGDLYNQMMTERAPAVANTPNAAQRQKQIVAQYQSMRRIIDTLRYLSDRASMPLWPVHGQTQIAMHQWTAVYVKWWFQTYRQELITTTASFQGVCVFDAIGTRFKHELMEMEHTTRAIVAQIDTCDASIEDNLIRFKEKIADLTSMFRLNMIQAGC